MRYRYKILFSFFLALLAWVGLLAMGRGFLFLEAAVLLVSSFYVLGLIRLWRSAGVGHGVPVWRAVCFFVGMAILTLALSSPVDELTEQAFSMHMIQHMLLVKVIAPLLLLGEFSSLFLWAAGKETAHQLGTVWNRSHRLRAVWRQLTSPWIAWTLFASCLWLWHIPTFYQAALNSEYLHDLEHVMFLGTSLLFWWILLQKRQDSKTRYGVVVLYLFTTLLHESALGGLLTFSSQNWYPAYVSPGLWGLSPLADQQLAGLIMWLPGGMLFMLLIVLFFGWWLQAIERSLPVPSPRLAQTGDRND